MRDGADIVPITGTRARKSRPRSDRLEPAHNREAERAVLGGVMMQNDTLESARAELSRDDFFDDRHRITFDKICQVRDRGEPIDLITVREELDRAGELERAGGPVYLASLIDGVPRSVNVPDYARIVKRRSIERIFSYACQAATAAIATNPDESAAAIALVKVGLSALESTHVLAETVTESLADLMTRVSLADPRTRILGELLALGEIAMLHGQPRDGKTWIALDIAIAVATGTRAFGLERLAADAARGVLVLNNEDPPAQLANRVRLLLAGRGVDALPDRMYFIAGRGVDLDDAGWQATVLAEIQRLQIALVVLDPLRSLTAGVDQGPNELRPFATFLRRVVRETGATLLLVHHDTKPGVGPPDTRRHAQRASGGAIFSIVDAPIHVERVDERRSLVAPDGFKFTTDPAPFVFERIERDGGMLLTAEAVSATVSAADVALHGRLREYLRDNPGNSGTAIAKALKARKQAVGDALDEMERAGLVDCVDGARRARLWMLKS